MNKQLLRHFILVLSVVYFMFGCKKEREHKFVPIPASVRDYFGLKTGSYIVLKDSLNNQVTDTFRLELYQDTIEEYYDYYNKKYIKKEVIACFFYGNYAKLDFSQEALEQVRCRYESYEYSRIENNLPYPGNWGFVRGFVVIPPAHQAGASFMGLTQTGLFDSITIEGQTFTNVTEVKGISTATSTATFWRSLFNKENFLIQLEIKNDSLHRVWQQVSSNLIR